MPEIFDYFVPWLKGQKMYFSPHIDLAWRRPELHRLMSNENPNPPSDKVIEAILKYAKMANRYADQGFAVRGKLAEMNGLPGFENALLGNGSSEVYDMILRSFLQPGDEVIQHTPCFGIYKLRTMIAGGKIVSVPMKYKWGDEHLQYDPDGILKAITPKTKVIIVANPNNPTGNFMDAAGLRPHRRDRHPLHCRRGLRRVRRRQGEVPGRAGPEVPATSWSPARCRRPTAWPACASATRWATRTSSCRSPPRSSRGTRARSPCGPDWRPWKTRPGLKLRVDFNNGELDRIMNEVNKIPNVKAFPTARQLHALRTRRRRARPATA